ncbi:GMC family oxidoreductase [Coraliomargarita sp. W4R53]
MSAVDFDFVIVGSGAGGGTMAYALTQQGYRVRVLEAGPRYNPFTDYKLDRSDWERQYFPAKPDTVGRYTYAEMQALEAQHEDLRSWNRVSGRLNKGTQRKAYKYHHVRGVGGSTLAFTGESHRLHPDAMQMQTRFGMAADWPLDYAALEPYYCEAEKLVGVAGPNGADARWRSQPYPLPAHALGCASQHLKAAAESLGLTWQPNARAALSRPYDGRPNCNYCGNCTRGCPRTDKGSVDVTFLKKAESTGRCQVDSGMTVLRIEAGADDRVRGLSCLRADGQSEWIETPQLVLSCGAVETPRLLLHSANRYAPNGLANESGQVGRNFMETLAWSSSALHPEPLGSHRGLPSDSICWDFNAPDAIPEVVGGCRFSTGVSESGLNGPLAYAQRVVPAWGQAHKTAMRDAFGHALTVSAIGESLPNQKTFIDLDLELKDAQGVPVARIHSHLDAMAIARLKFMAMQSRRLLEAAGAGELVDEYGSYDYFSSTHVFGTCRMGSDVDSSVVDASGRSHRWQNLRIMDASIFPSSGGGESPSLTIQALALRAVAQI